MHPVAHTRAVVCVCVCVCGLYFIYLLGCRNHDFPHAGAFGAACPMDCPFLPGCAPHYARMCRSWGRDLDAVALASCSATGYYYVDGTVE